MSHARQTTPTFIVMYLSPLTPEVYLLVKVLFISYLSPLFFIGLLSYLVGMKRRTSKRVVCNAITLIFFVMYLSSLTSVVCLLVNLFSKLYVTFILSGLLSYLVGIKRRTSRRAECKRDNSHFLRYILIAHEVEILCRP